jgi:membrane protease YdiL (CAAX protease family)
MNINLGERANSLGSKIKNIITGFGIYLIWVTLISGIFKYLYSLPTPAALNVFMACIVAPLWEELVFRVAPLQIAKGFGEKYLIPVIIISSAIFGWGHGEGTYSILIQGVLGAVLSWVYIKNNYSYWSVVAVHAMWNALCYLYEI